MPDDENFFPNNLVAQGKLKYAQGKRPNVDCILCSIRDNDPKVKSLKIFEDKDFFISLNLYPYNPGHLMVIPKKHAEDFAELTIEERNLLFQRIIECQNMLKAIFNPSGFNVGYNQGQYAGASISHIHVHVVPRYKEELGFIDIIGKTKIVVENVDSVFAKIKARINEFIT